MATDKQIRNGADMEAPSPPNSSPAARHVAHQATAAAEVARGLAQPGQHRPASDIVQGPRQVVTPKMAVAYTIEPATPTDDKEK
jgi:hypothetical protein